MSPRRSRPLLLLFLLFSTSLFSLRHAKTLDPYKALGVDRSATQRDIQKAFHKLSLKYHPDKNNSKGAKEKFTEINNAYEILSDEEKRKNYDLYGDEKGNHPGYDANDFGNGKGYTYFTGGPGGGHFSNYDGWQSSGDQGNTKSFSFSFSGDPSVNSNPFGGFGDMFSNLFGNGMKGSSQFGGFSGGRPNSNSASSGVIEDVNLQFFNKNIKDQGLTWLLLFYTPSAKGYRVFESIVEDVSSSLSGALTAGRINCLNEQSLCKNLGVSPSKSARLFVYSPKSSDGGSMVEYSGEIDSRSLKNFCQDQLPRFSKRVDLGQFDFSSSAKHHLPQVLLISTKKDTPVMWRALSGLYRNRFVFYDAEVHGVSDPILRRLGVDALPAVIGRLVNGEEHVLRAGIIVKDLKSGINELRSLLESFEKKNRKAASSQSQTKKSSRTESQERGFSYLTDLNFDSLCGDKTAVCIIGIFRSSKAKDKLETLFSEVSQKTLVRRQYRAQSSGDSITYALLDAGKQTDFLYAFDKSGYKSLDKLVVAYKPKRKRFAVFTGQMTMEEVEKFISSVLSGDVLLSQVRRKPEIR